VDKEENFQEGSACNVTAGYEDKPKIMEAGLNLILHFLRVMLRFLLGGAQRTPADVSVFPHQHV
jgi:hypothetical protein